MPLAVKMEVIKSDPKLRVKPITARAIREGGKMALNSIIRNVERQQQWDGTAIQPNAESTRKRKENRRRNPQRPALSLIDQLGRFLDPRYYKIRVTKRGKNYLGFRITHTARTKGKRRMSLLRAVTQLGFVGWFMPTERTLQRITALWRREMKAAGKRGVSTRAKGV